MSYMYLNKFHRILNFNTIHADNKERASTGGCAHKASVLCLWIDSYEKKLHSIFNVST